MTRSNEELDQLIQEALEKEDEALKDFAEEPGYFQQAFGMFRGKLAWVVWVMYITNMIGAGIAIWAAWKMLQTTDPVMTVRWGVLAIASVNIGLFMKGGMGLHGQVNRVLREVKRLELQIVRGQGRD